MIESRGKTKEGKDGALEMARWLEQEEEKQQERERSGIKKGEGGNAREMWDEK